METIKKLKQIKLSIKNEIFSLIDNRVNQLIETYNKYIDYSKTREFKDHKKIYDFGLRCSDKSKMYNECITFMNRYSWLIDKVNYYKSKYPNLVFIDEHMDDDYFFESYKQESTSQVRMMGMMFSGDISISDINIIENNLLSIDNNDRLVHNPVNFNTLCFGDLNKEEKSLVLSDSNYLVWKGVEIISHSSFLFGNEHILSEYWGVVLSPVDKGFLVLHRF